MQARLREDPDRRMGIVTKRKHVTTLERIKKKRMSQIQGKGYWGSLRHVQTCVSKIHVANNLFVNARLKSHEKYLVKGLRKAGPFSITAGRFLGLDHTELEYQTEQQSGVTETLTPAGVIDTLFERFNAHLKKMGIWLEVVRW